MPPAALSSLAIANLVVDAMEMLYCGQEPRWPRRSRHGAVDDALVVRRELASSGAGHPRATLAALAQLVWQLSVRLRRPTIWCLRSQHPTSAGIQLVCWIACVNTADLLASSLTDDDFDRLTISVGLLAKAKLVTCRVTSHQEFRAVLAETRLRRSRPALVCDWPLSGAQVRAVMRSGVRVIAPSVLRWKPVRFP